MSVILREHSCWIKLDDMRIWYFNDCLTSHHSILACTDYSFYTDEKWTAGINNTFMRSSLEHVTNSEKYLVLDGGI